MAGHRARYKVDQPIGGDSFVDVEAVIGFPVRDRQIKLFFKDIPAGNSVRVLGSIKGGVDTADWHELAVFLTPGVWDTPADSAPWPYIMVTNSGPHRAHFDAVSMQVLNTMAERPTI